MGYVGAFARDHRNQQINRFLHVSRSAHSVACLACRRTVVPSEVAPPSVEPRPVGRVDHPDDIRGRRQPSRSAVDPRSTHGASGDHGVRRHRQRSGRISAEVVAALSTPPRLRRAPGRSLTIDEAHRLLRALDGHRLEALFVLMLAFGLRRGEALGLSWANLDATRSTLRVTHGVKRLKRRLNGGPLSDDAPRTELVLGQLKTARAMRTL